MSSRDRDTRRQELADNLAALEGRLQAACTSSSRDRAEVTLVAITKTWPTTDAELLRELGVRDLGENRDAEARDKAASVRGVRWHFVGSVQTNKARSVASYADVVHSLDRPSLCAALDRGAGEAGRALTVLLQVSLDGDVRRGGAPPAAIPPLADQVAASGHLILGGLMAVAPRGADPGPAFDQLSVLSAALVEAHPGARIVSAGMSGDLEQAIAAGSTHVRVGTAILGHRSTPLR